jgi:dipeptidyl aminopeptidase/acylaminoacyl peptidase
MKKLFFLLCLIPIVISSQTKHPLTVEDLWAMKRVGSFDLSADGKTIAFSVTTYDMDVNKGNSDIYLVDADGSHLRVFKNSDENKSEPKFTPDGKSITFVQDGQIWITYNLFEELSLIGPLTDIPTDASGIIWSSDGTKILFKSLVYPECKTQNCSEMKEKAKEDSQVKAQIFSHLMFRHWNEWRNGKWSHLFLQDVKTKKHKDLFLQKYVDVPPIALGSDNDYCFSPDGKQIALTMNPDTMVSISTNNEIYLIDLDKIKEDESAPIKKISTSKGNDNQPVYSPDGKYIAYVSMKHAGFESDKTNLVLYDRTSGKSKIYGEDFDRSVGQFTWSPDSKTIYFVADNEIYSSVYKLDISSGKIEMILKEHDNTALKVSPDGKKIFFLQQRNNLPTEIFSMNTDGSDLKQITFMNKDRLANIEMIPIETFWSEGAGGKKVESIIVKPPFFDPSKKYPMILLVHGGPQGHWSDDFHYRWNTQLFASKGYVVIAPNPRGSTGYGQQFTNEITLDWGGKVYTDIVNATDYALNNFNFIDKENTFAAGASYGGYMMNWMEGHTDRFNAVVSHDGVFDLTSMYGATEELWFPEWEYGGTPWESREVYKKWSPHMYIQNAKTPMLVVQGANDFRVPEGQAFELFTSLQRLGVESKLLYFPDEYHFVVKPQDAVLWWNTIFDWFDQHKK